MNGEASSLIGSGHSIPVSAYRFIRTWPVIPFLIMAVLVVCAIFAPLIAPHDPLIGDLRAPNTPPIWYSEGSSKYILGTDTLGRDVLSRAIFGARISLIIVSIVLSTGAVFGTTIGLLAGYYGGHVDEILMRFVDLTLAVPFILVALVVVIVLGQSLTIIIVLISILTWSGFSRQVRAEVLSLRTRDYVALAKVAGASDVMILYKHILPGVLNTVIVIATLNVANVILAEAVLSFLGVGVPPPTPAWGAMISDGRDFLGTAWWLAFFPGIAIFLTVVAFNFTGDWLRDKLDPRLRQL